MYENLRKRVDELFENAPKTRRVNDFKEELMANLIDKYNDLTASGKSEEDAINETIDSVGDVDELIRGLKEPDIFNYKQMQKDREKSAVYKTAASAIYIMSVVVLILLGSVFEVRGELAVCIMLTMDAVATCLIIYNNSSRPKYLKADNTMVEEFKEWKSENIRYKDISRSVRAIVWLVVLILYFVISFSLQIWPYSWIIFIIGAAADRIVALTLQLRMCNHEQ